MKLRKNTILCSKSLLNQVLYCRFTEKKSALHAQASLFLSNQDDIEALVAMVTSLHEGRSCTYETQNMEKLMFLCEEGYMLNHPKRQSFISELSSTSLYFAKSKGYKETKVFTV